MKKKKVYICYTWAHSAAIRLFPIRFPRDKEAPGGDKKIDLSPGSAAEAPPVEAKKGGEGGAGDDMVVSPAPMSAESRTAQLSKRVEAEGEMADSRAKRMANLSSELKK